MNNRLGYRTEFYIGLGADTTSGYRTEFHANGSMPERDTLLIPLGVCVPD